MREEIRTQRAVHNEQMEALKENARLLQKLKPSRDTLRLSGERKMLIAGQQLFRCAAPARQGQMPVLAPERWKLWRSRIRDRPRGSLVEGIHAHRATQGRVCHLCHGLLSRLQRIEAAEKGERGEEEEEEEE